ncbi:PLP-dependent aminotransferase family protein [Corynebacterium pacaense]|uniref:aminotransferase-like domain-containing protein n=1 Tax=Corynebacterium pacaense TaxID=1816684 RepID=UPI0009BBD7A6|nr:PLP-dependent aminotransferase family protein [Corynebacterium pacaense]
MTQTLKTPETSQANRNRRTALVRAFTEPKGFGDATLRNPRPDAIELLGGIPDPGLLPTAELSEAAVRVLARPGAPALQYGRTRGWPELLSWISEREDVPVEQLLITNGGFHGLNLAVSLVVERGDPVAVDNPVFPLFLRGLEISDARVVPIGVDSKGLDVDHLEEILRAGQRISAVYTVPDFHNPSQGSLSQQRRRKLVELAEEHDFHVIADNPYREINFTGAPVDVSAFNGSDRVIHVNTFTKTLGPGLRLGWIRLPEELAADAIALRSRQDSHTSLLVQAIVAEYLTSDPGAFDRQLARANQVYAGRARTLVDALDRELPGFFDLQVPEGGFFLWPRLQDDSIDADALAASASRHGVEYQRGSFFPSGPGTDSDRRLRLSYSNVGEDRLDLAARQLAGAVAALRAQ